MFLLLDDWFFVSRMKTAELDKTANENLRVANGKNIKATLRE